MEGDVTKRGTVLIVDDSPENIFILKGILSDCYTIIVATTGERALELAESAAPDLILLDIRLPGIDGYEVCSRIKSHESTRNIPVIFISTLSESADEEHGFSVGCVDYITKPISPSKTLARVTTHIKLRKAAEELAMERSRAVRQEGLEKLAIIANGIPSLIAHLDKDKCYQYVNRAYSEWVGMNEDGIIGRSVRDVVPEEVYPILLPCIERALQGESSFLEMPVSTNGSERTHYVSLVPQFDESGGVKACFALITDITEQRQLADQLRHSQKMDAIGQLAGGVAHDFNNILSVIMGYAELISIKVEDDPELSNEIRLVSESAQRAAHLTQSLLSFSRKQPMKTEVLDLNSVVWNVEKFLKRIIGEDINLSIQMSDVPLVVSVDSSQIEQVMMNLAANARDAMSGGGDLAMELQLHELNEQFIQEHGYGIPGKYAKLTVSDTGNGMDEATRQRIFEPFFTTKDIGKGTGLGLSIVYGIIKQHNGFINVQSEPGEGTSFIIYIPLQDQASRDAAKLASTAPQPGTETVLVVEDDATVRAVTVAILSKFGYVVIEAEDGLDAFDKFSLYRNLIQLVMMDIILPKMNGMEVAQRMRQVQPDVKLLFTSGYNMEIIQSRGNLNGDEDILIKPVKPTELLLKVRTVLDA